MKINQKKRLAGKQLRPKHKKAFRFIWLFNKFFLKLKSYNFFIKLKKNFFTKHNFFLMFYYFYNLKTNMQFYKKNKTKFINNNFLLALQFLELRLDVIVIKIIFLKHLQKSQILIKQGFVFLNNYIETQIKICNIFDIIWVNTVISYSETFFKIFFFLKKSQIKKKKHFFKYWIKKNFKKYNLKYNLHFEIDFKVKKLIILNKPKIKIPLINHDIFISKIRHFTSQALKHNIKNIYLCY